jgi:hypothetical protein
VDRLDLGIGDLRRRRIGNAADRSLAGRAEHGARGRGGLDEAVRRPQHGQGADRVVPARYRPTRGADRQDHLGYRRAALGDDDVLRLGVARRGGWDSEDHRAAEYGCNDR